MINTSTGKGDDDSDDEKAALVRRLQAMEAEEEHDGMFDNPVPFGSAAAQAVMTKNQGKPTTTMATATTSVSCDADDGADHFVYMDAEQD